MCKSNLSGRNPTEGVLGLGGALRNRVLLYIYG